MDEKIYIFGHKAPDTDSICSSLVMEKFEQNLGLNVEAKRLGKVNKETEYVLNYLGIEAPALLEKVEEGQKVILVDHNEFDQSVEGIENANIETVIDHHRIANFQTKTPLYYRAEPVGCTSTILYKKFKEEGMQIEKKEATLMLSAIVSDTLLLKSPTTTEDDKKALTELAKIAEIDLNEYGIEMLKAGTNLDDFSEEELINLDAKRSEKNGKKFVIAQVNTVSIPDVLKRKEKIETAMRKDIEANDIKVFIFAITDILNSNTQIIVLGEETAVAEKGFAKNLEDNMMFLEGVVSRKKQILPVIDQNL